MKHEVPAKMKLIDRIEAEPAYRDTLFKVLRYCETDRPTAEIVFFINSLPAMRAAVHSPVILMKWLIESGGLDRMSGKEEVERWQTTEVGKQALMMQKPVEQIQSLLASESNYRETFIRILSFCRSPRTRDEIEDFLKTQPGANDHVPIATFLVQSLEKAGGLEWIGKWRTTESGQEMLA